MSQEHVTRVAPAGVVRFVGASASGDGSPSSPYQTIDQAVAQAANGTTLIFKTESYNRFSAPTLTISRPLKLRGIEASIGK
jgi:hypothetical protein